jgi:hypothetical protein
MFVPLAFVALLAQVAEPSRFTLAIARLDGRLVRGRISHWSTSACR